MQSGPCRSVRLEEVSAYYTKQDWHNASFLGLSICVGVRIIATKTAPGKLAMISSIQHVHSYAIQVVQSYDYDATFVFCFCLFCVFIFEQGTIKMLTINNESQPTLMASNGDNLEGAIP